MSVQTTLQRVDAIIAGLDRLNQEIEVQKQSRDMQVNDRFVQVMEVIFRSDYPCHRELTFFKPFAGRKAPVVEALNKMGKAVGVELRSLLMYYGESPDSPEGPKPDDFFTLIVSFSTSLQVCIHFDRLFLSYSYTSQKSALEVLDYQAKTQSLCTAPKIERRNEISVGDPRNADDTTSTASSISQIDSQSKRTPPRGELDQAIRSIRQGALGKRREQAKRDQSIRLSKFNVDGSNSRPSHRYD